ncbi:hypothetical protein Slin14017_G110520 [Septoria linicola]|nr:hypothetical protein Slin14017_G110520 [Septoria linicola]
MSKNCLTDQDTDVFVKAYQDMLAKNVAKQHLRPDLISASDSDAFENQLSLNSTNYNGLQAWIDKLDGQMSAHFDTLVVTHNCDTITWYQEFNQGGMQPVRAISIWFVDMAKMQIYKHYWEHNSGLTAWLQGYFKDGYNVTVGQDGPKHEISNCRDTCELQYDRCPR